MLSHLRRPARDIVDPILEPYWEGLHVLAHFDRTRTAPAGGPWLTLIDTEGDDATDDEPEVIAELAGAILAEDAVIDGVLTEQATRSGEGVAMVGETTTPRLSLLSNKGYDIDMRPRPEDDAPHPFAFVAIDLLRLDGTTLIDLPLLERKRLLDAVVSPGPLVRVSPYTRPPLRGWLQSWKSAGFSGLVVKAANSRYVPTSVTREWTVVTKIGGR
jgi:bifunctional non-homologous end joining protein LigD